MKILSFNEFISESRTFNDKVIEITDRMSWGTQEKVIFRYQDGEYDSVILDPDDDSDDIFGYTDSEFILKSEEKPESKPEKKVYKIIAEYPSGKTEVIKDGIYDRKLAYSLRWTFQREPKYRRIKIKVV